MKIGIFIGCAIHRYYSVVQEIIYDLEDCTHDAHIDMKKLKTPKDSAKLHLITHLHPLFKTDTRWSSTYSRISRYIELKRSIKKLNNRDFTALLPTQE